MSKTDFSREDILKMLTGTKADFFCSGRQLTRIMEIFTSDGYGSSQYRTTFFCIQGSPNKVVGWIQEYCGGFILVCNFGTYYFNSELKRVAKYRTNT